MKRQSEELMSRKPKRVKVERQKEEKRKKEV